MLTAALVVALTAAVMTRADAGVSRCDQFRADSVARAAQVTGRGERVVVIGDSWSAGLGLAQAGAVLAVPAAGPGARRRLLRLGLQRAGLAVRPGVVR